MIFAVTDVYAIHHGSWHLPKVFHGLTAVRERKLKHARAV